MNLHRREMLKSYLYIIAICMCVAIDGICPESGHVGFVVVRVELEYVFSEYFRFPYQFSFHQLLHL
jgi:hypothetical protein